MGSLGSTASIIWDVFFGIVGSGYFLYGKRQQEIPPLMCGFGLMIFPYFVSNTFLLVIIGAALMAVPFVFRE